MSRYVSHDDVQSRPPERVCVGVIIGVHGVRGLVRVRSFTENPYAIEHYGSLTDREGQVFFSLSVLSLSKGIALCRIDGVTNRSSAEALRGQEIYASRECLPPLEDEETFYHTDIVGLPAFGPNDMPVGIVRGLFDFGAGDVMEIEGSAGRSFFVPFTRKDVPVVDIKGRRVGLGHDLHLFSASATDVTTDPIGTLGGQRSRSPQAPPNTNG